MPLTPEQEWIIAACGLIAHADGDLSPGESDQMLAMLDERLTPDEHQRWATLLVDGPALTRAFAELPPPLPAFTEPLLEKAWTMALADGHASDAELTSSSRSPTSSASAPASSPAGATSGPSTPSSSPSTPPPSRPS